MAIEQTIFPKGCWLGFLDDGNLSPVGQIFINEQRLSEWKGNGAEHPCYGCRKDDCSVRTVDYHDRDNQFYVKPRKAVAHR